jgi:hypothetical protein
MPSFRLFHISCSPDLASFFFLVLPCRAMSCIFCNGPNVTMGHADQWPEISITSTLLFFHIFPSSCAPTSSPLFHYPTKDGEGNAWTVQDEHEMETVTWLQRPRRCSRASPPIRPFCYLFAFPRRELGVVIYFSK